MLHALSLSLKRVILIQEASGKSLYQAFVTTVSRDLSAQSGNCLRPTVIEISNSGVATDQ